LLIIFIGAIEKKSHSAKDTLIHFKVKLLDKLPLESEKFLTKLEVVKLLPDSSGSVIRANDTREQKVSYFLEHVVKSDPDICLPELIGIMKKEDDNLLLIKLASDMNEYMGQGNILVCMMTLSKLNTYVCIVVVSLNK